MRSRPPPKRVTEGVDTTATVATSVSVKPILHICGKNLSMLREITKQNRTNSSSNSSSDSDSEETVTNEAAKNTVTPRLTQTMSRWRHPRVHEQYQKIEAAAAVAAARVKTAKILTKQWIEKNRQC